MHIHTSSHKVFFFVTGILKFYRERSMNFVTLVYMTELVLYTITMSIVDNSYLHRIWHAIPYVGFNLFVYLHVSSTLNNFELLF